MDDNLGILHQFSKAFFILQTSVDKAKLRIGLRLLRLANEATKP